MKCKGGWRVRYGVSVDCREGGRGGGLGLTGNLIADVYLFSPYARLALD